MDTPGLAREPGFGLKPATEAMLWFIENLRVAWFSSPIASRPDLRRTKQRPLLRFY